MANLTPQACRAARALLSLTSKDLAESAGVSLETVNKFENGRPMRDSNKAKLAAVFEAAGVEILNGDAPGARLRPGSLPSSIQCPPNMDSEREAVVTALAQQIDFLDALEDAGIKGDLGKLDLSAVAPEMLERLMRDPRYTAIKPSDKAKG